LLRQYTVTTLQGKGKLLPDVFLDIIVFEMKLKFVNKHVEERNLFHFPSCKSAFEISREERRKEKFSEIVQLLQNLLSSFNDFHSYASKIHFQNSFKVDISNVVSLLHMEVTELETNDSLKNAFEPPDLRIIYYGPPYKVFLKIRKFTRFMMTVLEALIFTRFMMTVLAALIFTRFMMTVLASTYIHKIHDDSACKHLHSLDS
jgi:hypothetical protein